MFLASPISAELPGGGGTLEWGKEPRKGEGQGKWPILMAADFLHGILLFHNAFHDSHVTTEHGGLGLGPCRSSRPHFSASTVSQGSLSHCSGPDVHRQEYASGSEWASGLPTGV